MLALSKYAKKKKDPLLSEKYVYISCPK